MPLSQTYLSILAQIELNAELEAAVIARRLRLKTANVQRAIQRLIEMQVIVGRTVVIDLNKLGITEYGISLKLADATEATLQNVSAYLMKNKAVSWLAEMESDVDFMFNLVSPSAYEVNRFFNKFSKDLQVELARKDFCIRVERMRFWRGYLGYHAPSGLRFHSSANCPIIKLDELDLQILTSLSGMRFESMRELAAHAEIPIASFLRRVKSLREKQVILGLGYRIDPSFLNMQQYRLQISAGVNSPDVLKLLKNLCTSSPWIKMLAVCIGAWDYEMEVDVPGLRDLKILTQEIERLSKPHKLKVRSHALVEHLKYINFPATISTDKFNLPCT